MMRGLADRMGDPLMPTAMTRWMTNQDAALANADALLNTQEGALHAVR